MGYTLGLPVVSIRVRGLPVPQGAIRSLGKGRPSIHANAARLKPWRELVQHAVEDQLPEGWVPICGPVALHATFTMPKPKSAPKRRRTWPITRPDLSHLVRAAEDAITASGCWRDDSQIVYSIALKVYPSEHPDALPTPGVALSVHKVEHLPEWERELLDRQREAVP